jgi:uncharacterized repeat protein (TIGR03803 family)
LQYYSATSCGTACEITNWNGKWFADDDGNGNGMAVIRDPHSTWPAVVAIDTDAGSASNLTSVALKVPAGGWSGTVTESEYVCFYDLTSWPAASRSAGELPTGCQVYGAYASKIVYSFAGSPTLRSADGANPSAELVADKTGAFYGVTLAGGANLCKSTATKHESCGTIFKLTPPATTGGAWTESVVFNFQQKDGWAPLGRFRISDGLIYGTTYYGGTGCQPAGCGVVYSVDQRGPGQPALEKVLHAFVLTTDGHNPNPRLVADSTGAMYGSTLSGGAYNAGIIFKMTPPAVKGQAWGYADIYDFTGGADGGTPNDFTLATNGTIYGTTQAGGANLQGIAYELAPPATAGGAWTLTDLHDFAGGADGATPMAGTVQDAGGAIYGTTAQGGGTGCGGAGCGTVFVLTPTAGGFAESVVYAFTGAPDGATPTAPLIGTSPGPVLYGTTSAGGAGSGTVFQLTPPAVSGGTWTETIIDSFAGKPDGAGPDGRLYIDKSGVLYGTTLTGGASGAGAIYQMTP